MAVAERRHSTDHVVGRELTDILGGRRGGRKFDSLLPHSIIKAVNRLQ